MDGEGSYIVNTCNSLSGAARHRPSGLLSHILAKLWWSHGMNRCMYHEQKSCCVLERCYKEHRKIPEALLWYVSGYIFIHTSVPATQIMWLDDGAVEWFQGWLRYVWPSFGFHTKLLLNLQNRFTKGMLPVLQMPITNNFCLNRDILGVECLRHPTQPCWFKSARGTELN